MKKYFFTHLCNGPLSKEKIEALRIEANQELLQLNDYSKTLEIHEMFAPANLSHLLDPNYSLTPFNSNKERAFSITFYYE